ncbi:putative neurotoxin LTDF S-18-like protein [Leptotrombidium deliense]|uniref:Putative neurotoxin LTDF S-18-like protein n=1 Tax=Leptotrombidium deliense TaxID=299467 RepID=A0A443R9E0_9ACAR|nr:putative neurotoxin LTDF S-18-like protein [Leptotrombidium deliense]
MNCFEVIVLVCLVGATVANVVPLQSKTKCQEHRERELNLTVAAKIVPQCDANGDYVALVCVEGDKGPNHCSCYTKQGAIAKSPSPNVKKCECYNERYGGLNPPRIGSFIARCEEDGSYSKLQCHGSTGMCWCSHPDGKQKTKPARAKVVCP